jgi:hypothetical protein
MAMSKLMKSGNDMLSSICENPPIPLICKPRKKENVDGSNVDKTQLIKLKFFMDPRNTVSKYDCHSFVFKDGCAEEWVKWLMAYHEIESLMPLKEPDDKSMILRTLLKGQALLYLEHHLRKRLDAEDVELPDDDLLELVIRDIGLEYIHRCTIRVQKYYTRRGLFMGPNTSMHQFVEWLNL